MPTTRHLGRSRKLWAWRVDSSAERPRWVGESQVQTRGPETLLTRAPSSIIPGGLCSPLPSS